jgi:hypothetical protein
MLSPVSIFMRKGAHMRGLNAMDAELKAGESVVPFAKRN